MERAIKEIWLLFWYNITVVLVQQKGTKKGLHCCSGTTKTAFYGVCTVVLVHTFIDIYHGTWFFYWGLSPPFKEINGDCPHIISGYIGGNMFENWNRFVQETTERLTDTKETERKGELCGHNPENCREVHNHEKEHERRNRAVLR